MADKYIYTNQKYFKSKCIIYTSLIIKIPICVSFLLDTYLFLIEVFFRSFNSKIEKSKAIEIFYQWIFI